VDDVGAGGNDIAHFLAQAGEVCGQDAGSDAVGGHGGLQVCNSQGPLLYDATPRFLPALYDGALQKGKPMPVYDFAITVRTQYLPEQSKPDRSLHVFSYTITIKNTGSVPAQLIARHWVITDTNGKTQEVRGLGVVGHQPLLKPGEEFEYTSGTQLETAQGSMVGEYFFVAEDGHRFEVNIPEFVLSLPRTLH
jgi:ApaG protein